MDQLSPGELLELVLLSESMIDSQLQFWLTATFATIVASFAARQLLTSRMRLIISSLYILATVVFVSRWFYEAVDLLAYTEALARAGIDNPIPVATALSRLALMALGTLATIYFVHFASMEAGG